MALFAQHGHGKSTKISTAIEDQAIQGVIFAARNEQPHKLEACIEDLRELDEDCQIFMDPQFYVSTLVPPNERYLPDYEYFESGLTATNLSSSRRLATIAQQTIDYQVGLELDGVISPTIIFDSFSDRWHQIALNMADASLEHHASLENASPLYLSFVFSEEALSSDDDIDRFLDAVTQDDWGMEGFYLIPARSDASYNQRFESQRLAQYLYLVYVLAEINNLDVICGYSDFVGTALRTVGASTFANGWSQSLRQFHRSRFIRRRGGGQPPLVRYSSAPLYNSIYVSELQQIEEIGELESVLSHVDHDETLRQSIAEWTTRDSQRHHWQTLSSMDEALPTGRVVGRLRTLRASLREADGLYRSLEAQGVQFARNTGKDHLSEWLNAIQQFQTRAGLSF